MDEVLVVVILEQQVLEILHQQHHHKEIMVVLDLVEQIQIMQAAEEEGLVLPVLMDPIQVGEMVVPDLLLLFLEHQ